MPDLAHKTLKNLFHGTYPRLKSGSEAVNEVIFQGFWPYFKLLKGFLFNIYRREQLTFFALLFRALHGAMAGLRRGDGGVKHYV